MKIVVTGGTGFLGSALAESLVADGNDVVVLSRFSGGAYKGVRYATLAGAAAEIDGAGAVVNLAGAGIADRRWTTARKAVLRQSRVSVTRAVVTAIANATSKPRVLVSGSAVGYYGSSLDAVFDESSPAGHDFLAELCAEWEREALAAEPHTRVVILRTGLVLGPNGGLLKKMIPPFRMFAGGPVGSGRQWMSWIQLADWIALVKLAIATDSARGPVNVVAPAPVTNRDFSTALGRALHRPSLLPLPEFVVRAIFGELADGALLASQNVRSRQALVQNYTFKSVTVQDGIKASIIPA
ncbi:MAG: TIGR01777 family protein [Acidobacteria bacterium]|nr:MAG: TIGR01777 family protein [Acidobacteriota bacterium]